MWLEAEAGAAPHVVEGVQLGLANIHVLSAGPVEEGNTSSVTLAVGMEEGGVEVLELER